MKTILVAAVEISGRFADKKGEEPKRQIIEAGTPLTSALIKKFDLEKDGTLARLIERRHVVEQRAHVISEGDGPTAGELAAETKRADAAEAKVAEHEATIADLAKQLEAATAPAKA